VPSYVVNTVNVGPELGWGRLRRIALNLDHGDACTVQVTPLVDGRESGAVISRTLALGAVGVLTIPCAESGTGFAYKVSVTSYSSPVAFSNSEVYVVPKRGSRS
jgi:hypothetical protein